MNILDKISNFFILSTPVIDDNFEKLLSNEEFRDKILNAIDDERKRYTSKHEGDNSEIEIKRIGEFQLNP